MRRHAIAVLAAGALLMMVSGPAVAVDNSGNPLGDLTKQVNSQVTKLVNADTPTASVPSKNAPTPPSSNDNSPGHTTPTPQRPDHGSSYVVNSTADGQSLVGVDQNKSTENDNGSTSSDSTILAVGGMTIIDGSHASSGGTHNASSDPTAPVCTNSGGEVCLNLLYSDASANKTSKKSSASSDGGLASACIGGTDPTGKTCNGYVNTGAGSASSSASRNLQTGDTQASSSSSLVNLCLSQTVGATSCSAGIALLGAYGDSNSNGHTDRGSCVAQYAVAGQTSQCASDPEEVSVPPNCAAPQLLCLFFNQGESYAGGGVFGTAQEALDSEVLPGVAAFTAGQSETLVHNAGPQAQSSPPTTTTTVKSPKKQASSAAAAPIAALGSVLPNTGGVWSGLLAIGFLLVGLGAAMVAWERRTLVRARA